MADRDESREVGKAFGDMLRERLEAGRIKLEDLMGQDRDEEQDDGDDSEA